MMRSNKLDPEQQKPGHDAVNHPSHYTSHPSGIECITITEHFSFNLGQCREVHLAILSLRLLTCPRFGAERLLGGSLEGSSGMSGREIERLGGRRESRAGK